jgi:hypothetical protein
MKLKEVFIKRLFWAVAIGYLFVMYLIVNSAGVWVI